MADTKLSALTEATTLDDADEVYVNDSGTSKRITKANLDTAIVTTANVTAAGALMDSEVDADIKTLVLPASTTISTFGATLVDDADAATARTTLGVDAAGTDNSTDVTLVNGTSPGLNYITLAGQAITVDAVDLAADVTGNLPVANLNSGTSAGGTTFWRGDGTWATPAGSGDLLADGTVPLTANWDVGAFTITGTQFISDIATGTAPFVVASTTQVANLNAATAGNADTVTTNANLSGAVSSVGNTTSLSTFTKSQLNTAVSDGTPLYSGDVTTNATHTGQVTGSGALTVDVSAITSQAADSPMAAAAGDLLLIADVSASPQSLKQVTAQSIADLAAGGGWADMTEAVWTGGTQSEVADGSTAVAFDFDTDNAYATSGANLLRLSNNTTPVFDFSYQGGIDHANSGATTAAHAQSLNLNWVATGAETSSGLYSTVIGANNKASAARTVAIGANNQATSQYATALGGQYNIATGVYSLAVQGLNAAAGKYAFASGAESSVSNRVTFGFGAEKFATVGDAQMMSAALKIATTDATQTTLLAADTTYVIPADTSWAFSALVIGRSDETDGNDSAAYRIEGLLARDESNNTALVGSVTVTTIAESAGATAWDVTAEADDTNEALAIKVTGEAATNIRWVCKLDIAQVGYA